MDYIIVIPSYNRFDTILKKTIPYLDFCKIPHSKIDIIVANKEQYKLYDKVIPKGIKIIIGVPGKTQVENWITNHYKQGQYLVHFDDNVKSITEYDCSGDNEEQPYIGEKKLQNLDRLIKDGFKQCKKYKTILFGINKSRNGFWNCKMKEIKYTNNRFINGPFFGIINDKSIKLSNENKFFDDIERSFIVKKKYGCIINLLHYSLEKKYFEKGGLDSVRQLVSEKERKKTSDFVAKKYKGFVEEVERKHNYASGKEEWALKLNDDKKIIELGLMPNYFKPNLPNYKNNS